jgi:hypothetical protein
MFVSIGVLSALIAIALIIYGYVDKVKWAKIVSIVLSVVAVISIIAYFNTAEGKRAIKDMTSNTSGGLERTVEVYDQSGKLIRTYEGKLDVQENEYGNKVLFDLNGKRTIIYNATVIVQEK